MAWTNKFANSWIVCCLAGSTFALIPGSIAIAASNEVESLPPAWSMESDEDYSYDADYVAPAPVPGLVIHGYAADDSISVEDGTISVSTPKNCTGPITFKDERDIPENYPTRTTGEYWYFRSGDEAVYLSRKWVYEVDRTCQGSAREVSRVVRVIWFNGNATFIEQDDGGNTRVSTERIVEHGYYPIPRWLVRMDDSDLREDERSRLVREAPSRMRRERDETTGVTRTCFDLSQFFFFATNCYYSGRGPWRGFLLSSDSQDDVGANYTELGTVRFVPRANIDGRLFEWDRRISRSTSTN